MDTQKYAQKSDGEILIHINQGKIVVGAKQLRKALIAGRAQRVYLASNADPAITDPVAESCAQAGIPVEDSHTMAQLGQACRITVGAAVVAVL